MNHNGDTSVDNRKCKLESSLWWERQTPAKPLMQYKLHVKRGASLMRRGHVKLARAASSHHPARSKVHKLKQQKHHRPQTIVFYSCNRSMHRRGSDTTDGVRCIENKKFPTAKRIKPTDLIYGTPKIQSTRSKQRDGDETNPRRFQSLRD